MMQVPTTRLARSRLPDPIACPISRLADMETPNMAPIIRKKTWLALVVAVRAAGPRTWLTQKALDVPLSD